MQYSQVQLVAAAAAAGTEAGADVVGREDAVAEA